MGAASLAPVLNTGRLFGDHGVGEERATALSQALAVEDRQPGFYLNGFSRSGPAGDTDPEDMFLVRTNAGGFTNSSILWEPGDLAPEPDDCPGEGHTRDPEAVSVDWQISKEKPAWGVRDLSVSRG